MATRTELLCYQLGLRLFQARELHDPQLLGYSPSLIRLSAIRLREVLDSLQPLPQLASVAQSAWGNIALWIDTPHYYERLRSAESWQYDDLMQQHREQLALIQEEFRVAMRQWFPEEPLENWLTLGAGILSFQDHNDRHVIDRLLSDLRLVYDAVLPDDDLNVAELDHELHESYFHGLEQQRHGCSNHELWDTAELGLQRLWKNIEEEPEQAKIESQAVTTQTEPDGSIRRGMTWVEVAERLKTLRSQGEAFTSRQKLADRLGCSSSTVQKAIGNTPELQGWAHRQTQPRASSLTGVVTDTYSQSREMDPADEFTIREYIETSDPETKAWFLELSPDLQLDFVNDPDRHPKILDRKP